MFMICYECYDIYYYFCSNEISPIRHVASYFRNYEAKDSYIIYYFLTSTVIVKMLKFKFKLIQIILSELFFISHD